MKVWIPFRENNAVLPLNSLSGNYYPITEEHAAYDDDLSAIYLRSINAFHRKKDAVAHMEKMNAGMIYPHKYKIVCFESK